MEETQESMEEKKRREERKEEEMKGEKAGKIDNGIVCDNEESSHYR